MTRHHYRVVNPIRFFIFVLISVFLITFAGYSMLNSSRAEAVTVNTYAQVVIQENDNLWDIASSYNPDRSDIRSIVYEIYEINDIDANDIHPGDVIFVPVY